jgi:hypothetical protein
MACARAALVLAVVVTMLAACGGKDRSHAAPSREARAAQSQALEGERVLRLPCDKTWVPNRRTFADPHWRRRSVRMGPVTFMLMRTAANLPVAAYGSIKFRTLVEPDTPVAIAIGAEARRDVGFYVTNVESGGQLPPNAKPTLALAGCPAVDRSLRVERGVSGVGYPVFLAVARNRCVPLQVTVPGQRPIKRVVSLGAGSCAPRSG